jgi:uncharacterized protein (DUF983 family)
MGKILLGLKRGLCSRCPYCGQGKIFQSYLQVFPFCLSCHKALKSFPSDDAPPYIALFLVAAIVVPLLFAFDQTWTWESWQVVLASSLFSLFLMFIILPPIKGAVIGLLWALDIQDR